MKIIKKIRSINSYKVLEKLARIPGHDKDGKQNSIEIVNWVRQVRAGCKKLARERACDHVLGKLFSTAFKEDEEVWLNEHVRDALEQVINEEMSISLKTALYNKRGVHTRGKGGGGGGGGVKSDGLPRDSGNRLTHYNTHTLRSLGF